MGRDVRDGIHGTPSLRMAHCTWLIFHSHNVAIRLLPYFAAVSFGPLHANGESLRHFLETEPVRMRNHAQEVNACFGRDKDVAWNGLIVLPWHISSG